MVWNAIYQNGGCSNNQELDTLIDRFSKLHSDGVLKKVKVPICMKESDENFYDFLNKITSERSDKMNTNLFKRSCGNYLNDKNIVQMKKGNCHTVLQRPYFREKKIKQKKLCYENKVSFRRNGIKTRITSKPMCFNNKKGCLQEALISRKTPDKKYRKHETANRKDRIRRLKKNISEMFNKYSVTRKITQFVNTRIKGSYKNQVILYSLFENARNTKQQSSNQSDTYKRFRKRYHKMSFKRRNLIFDIVPELRSFRNLERHKHRRRNGAKIKTYDTTVVTTESLSQESRYFGKKTKHCQAPGVIKVTEECQKKIFQRKNRGISSVKIYNSVHTRVHKRQMNYLLKTRNVSKT